MTSIWSAFSFLLGTSLNYPGINTESFLTSLTLSDFFYFFTSFHLFSPFYLLSEVLCILSLLDMSLTGPEINTESFLSLRTFKKFCVFLSLVKVFFLFLGFVFLFHCTLSTARSCISACCRESIHNRDGPGGIQYLCSFKRWRTKKWGLYGVAEQKGVWRTVLYNGLN